jgi:hypothetical protein
VETRVKRKTDRDDALKLARLAAVGEIEGVPVPPRAIRQWKSLIGFRKRLVSERVRGQNRIRGLLVCQGLPAPVGAKAWTALGLAGIGQFAQPLAACVPDDLWRGELDRLLDRLRFLDTQTRAVEAKLDELAKSDSRVSLLETVPGVGTRTAEVIAVHLPDAKRFPLGGRSERVRGPGAASVSERRDRPPRTDHAPRAETASRRIGRVRVVQPALQPLGEGDVAAFTDQRPLEEEGDRGAGAEAVGPLLGDPADRPAVEVADAGPGRVSSGAS